MLEQQEIPLPAENRKAEKRMTPVQRAMSKARFEIMSHEQDFEDTGISKEQVKKVAAKAGERAKQEFEQKEKEDPLQGIKKALERAADTPEERALARVQAKKLEDFRSKWTERIKFEKEIALSFNQPSNTPEIMERLLLRDGVDGIRFHPDPKGQKEYFVIFADFLSVPILSGIPRPSSDYVKRVVRELGIQSLSSLKEACTWKTERERGVPTEIPDVFISTAGDGSLVPQIELPALERAIDFPKS